MNYRDYLTASLAKFGIEKSDIDLIIIDNQINEVENADPLTAKRAMYKSFSRFIPLANVREADMSITWNFEALKLWYKALADELGEEDVLKEDPKNQVVNKSYLW